MSQSEIAWMMAPVHFATTAAVAEAHVRTEPGLHPLVSGIRVGSGTSGTAQQLSLASPGFGFWPCGNPQQHNGSFAPVVGKNRVIASRWSLHSVEQVLAPSTGIELFRIHPSQLAMPFGMVRAGVVTVVTVVVRHGGDGPPPEGVPQVHASGYRKTHAWPAGHSSLHFPTHADDPPGRVARGVVVVTLPGTLQKPSGLPVPWLQFGGGLNDGPTPPP